MFHRATFGERLESEETHNVKVSGSRGSREMTFVVGKVRLLIFNLIRIKQYRYILYFIIFLFFFFTYIEKTIRGNETSPERIQRITTCKKYFQEKILVYKLTLMLNAFSY